ncbi:MAG: PHB depolymerase family esterase [Alphaproteobacteria bacterium]|nr:PHB depolymerase family esterase [Alphaproteobacteria bacterium]
MMFFWAGQLAASEVPAPSQLSEVPDFGSNPGNLKMYFRPAPSSGPGRRPAPLVVALHGASQDASSFEKGIGWATLADRHGFALLMPEQQFENNPNSCFTWYLPSHTERDRGEALSIKQMILHAIDSGGIDPDRVYIAGLSAGGAMTSVMLATYPEMFAGGAIFSGLPYGGTSSILDALLAMTMGREQNADHWADKVFSATPHRGSWPKVSIWHGTADPIVNPINANEILKQWTHVHGLSKQPFVEHSVDGQLRRVWHNDDGDEVIESVMVPGMGHGVPIKPDSEIGGCGNVSAFHFDVGISAGNSVIEFWGISACPPEPSAIAGGGISTGWSATFHQEDRPSASDP